MHADLASQFETVRDHLNAVAYRMLGSRADADDAVQETWLRLARADPGDIHNLRAWLTTVVARHCLDTLRSRKSKPQTSEALSDLAASHDTEAELLMADSLGPALLVILETLSPGERLAFVLHDLFAVPFQDIATILQRTPDAARQLASRARRRVQGGQAGAAERDKQREVVAAFIAAARHGDFAALVQVLHPDVQVQADATALAAGAPVGVRGAEGVAKAVKGRAKGGRLCLVDGVPGGVWIQNSRLMAAFLFTVEGSHVTCIRMVMDASALAALDIELL